MRQEYKAITNLDAQVAKFQHKSDEYKKLFLKVVESMEKIVNETTDMETVKALTIAFDDLKDDSKQIEDIK